MSAIPVLDAYQELLDDISEIVDSARSALVDAYRKIGQRIVEVEQNGQIRSRYGSGLLQQLSEDLTRRYGLGFSKRNLERMRLFYPGFCISKIRPEPPKASEGLRGQTRREFGQLCPVTGNACPGLIPATLWVAGDRVTHNFAIAKFGFIFSQKRRRRRN